MVGLIFNGLFAATYVVGLDGVNNGVTEGGWIHHNWKQMYIQIAYIVACTAYTFVVSAALAYGIDKIPGLHLRASEEAELLGMDDDQHGEFSYDYVEVRRDFLAWSPHRVEPAQNGEVVIEPQHGIQEHASLAHSPSFHSEPVAQHPEAEKKDASVADDSVTPASASRGSVSEKRD